MCHTTFHSLLRSSSMPEPRRPPRRCLWTRLGAGTPRCLSARVLCHGGGTPLGAFLACPASPPLVMSSLLSGSPAESAAFRVRSPKGPFWYRQLDSFAPRASLLCFLFASGAPGKPLLRSGQGQTTTLSLLCVRHSPPKRGQLTKYNDPSAGSPTETLLRLLLPLNREI